jgi:uncharacterized protein YecE (DUF72 family)
MAAIKARAIKRDDDIRVGCAGWSIISRHADLFGEGGSHLARYATRFDVVEINSSFYRPHRRETYERWAAAVPARFRFSVKVPKTITHDLRLQGAGKPLDRFAAEVAGLGGKLGGLLVQLPPSLVYDARIASTFFAMMRRRFDEPIACEPRHASWFEPEVDTLWQRHDIARAAADPARLPAASEAAGAGSLRYWRWHGSPRIYYSAYSDDALQALAQDLRAAAKTGATCWCLFDNTAGGHAIADAARLQALLGQRPMDHGKASAKRKASLPA